MRRRAAPLGVALCAACQAAPHEVRTSQVWWLEHRGGIPEAVCEFTTTDLLPRRRYDAVIGPGVWLKDRLASGTVEAEQEGLVAYRASFRLDLDPRALRELLARPEAKVTVYHAEGLLWQPRIWFWLDVQWFRRVVERSGALSPST